MSAKYLSVFLNTIVPTTSIKILAIIDMETSNQLIGAVCRKAARAVWITPDIGLNANIQEYFPAMLAE